MIYQRRSDGTYSVRVRGQAALISVRKSHGVWQYRLLGEERWRGTYRTRTEAGRNGIGHHTDNQIEQRRKRNGS